MGRSFAEIDLLFERNISARKFASTDVDVFGEHVSTEVMHNYEEKLDIHHSEHVVH
jgi:SP family general alpha glucoside:H+ symporter-like MFS transporter